MNDWLFVPGGEFSLSGLLAGLLTVAGGLFIIQRLPRISMLVCAIGTALIATALAPVATIALQIVLALMVLTPIVLLVAYWGRWSRRRLRKNTHPAQTGPPHRRPHSWHKAA